MRTRTKTNTAAPLGTWEQFRASIDPEIEAAKSKIPVYLDLENTYVKRNSLERPTPDWLGKRKGSKYE